MIPLRPLPLMPLTYKNAKALGTVTSPSQWVEIDVTVDIGACDTVMPKWLCEHIPMEPSQMSKQGLEYEAANGGALPNLGQRRLDVMTPGSNRKKGITSQAGPVRSVSVGTDEGRAPRL